MVSVTCKDNNNAPGLPNTWFQQIKSYWKIGLLPHCCKSKALEGIQLFSTIKFATTILVSPIGWQSQLISRRQSGESRNEIMKQPWRWDCLFFHVAIVMLVRGVNIVSVDISKHILSKVTEVSRFEKHICLKDIAPSLPGYSMSMIKISPLIS